MLEEHETVRVLDVVMHGVQEATGFEARPVHVLEAESQHLVECFGARLHAAGDDDHATIGAVAAAAANARSSLGMSGPAGWKAISVTPAAAAAATFSPISAGVPV